MCGPKASWHKMQIETKYLRLPMPVTVGSRFDDWRVCWLGGWSKYRLYYLVMLSREQPEPATKEAQQPVKRARDL
jgi:hypothetical protein